MNEEMLKRMARAIGVCDQHFEKIKAFAGIMDALTQSTVLFTCAYYRRLDRVEECHRSVKRIVSENILKGEYDLQGAVHDFDQTNGAGCEFLTDLVLSIRDESERFLEVKKERS